MRFTSVLAAENDLKEQLFGPSATALERETFESLFCARFACAPSAYELEVFHRCVHRRARLLARLILKRRPEFFADDFHFIHLVGEATSMREVGGEARRFRKAIKSSAGFLRRVCRVRVSGRAVLRLARELFQREACGWSAP